jgi:hypothetical protein
MIRRRDPGHFGKLSNLAPCLAVALMTKFRFLIWPRHHKRLVVFRHPLKLYPSRWACSRSILFEALLNVGEFSTSS